MNFYLKFNEDGLYIIEKILHQTGLRLIGTLHHGLLNQLQSVCSYYIPCNVLVSKLMIEVYNYVNN